MSTVSKKPIVIYGPSGTGKSTLLKRLFADYPVSNTTRQPRTGEVDGKDYHFLTREQFIAAVNNNEFIEHAEFSGNMYGTTIQSVKDVATSGKTCILDIDTQGVALVKKTDMGCSEDELERRLRGRGTDDESSIQKRLATAKKELEFAKQPNAYDVKIVNEDVEKAYKELVDFIFEKN
ncbi:putative guanylate kinase [Linderina pennispora]|uniref:guanylate kinase n=1 Tax=Linderina pennispora TaxID=61395 RepID=A0A1Y1W4T4_9FUNG|nr:putative guanylate kinase [Linderina pennispora]ORX68412.1 putative guanylate kinase [Linderina pennispora]